MNRKRKNTNTTATRHTNTTATRHYKHKRCHLPHLPQPALLHVIINIITQSSVRVRAIPHAVPALTHTSHVTHHTSHITRHTSHITHHSLNRQPPAPNSRKHERHIELDVTQQLQRHHVVLLPLPTESTDEIAAQSHIRHLNTLLAAHVSSTRQQHALTHTPMAAQRHHVLQRVAAAVTSTRAQAASV